MRITNGLLARRSELGNRLGVQLEDLRLKTSSAATGDAADAAFESSENELASRLAVVEARELAQVEYALARIQGGQYGSCAGCGEKIPVARLDALPYCTLCVSCQRETENN